MADDEDSTPLPKIYTLKEAAEYLRVPKDWLRSRLANRTYAALRRSNRWAMTEEQLRAVVESMTVPAREPETYPFGLTRRGWLYRQRYGAAGNPHLQGPRKTRGPFVSPPKSSNLPSDFRLVISDTPTAIAAMPKLTDTQRQFLERLEREQTVVVDGRMRKTVEALVRRGLATYEAECVRSELTNYSIYRLTVRPVQE